MSPSYLVSPTSAKRHPIALTPHCLALSKSSATSSSALRYAKSSSTTPTACCTNPYRIDTSLPGAFEIIRDLVFCIAIREVLFYYSHRLLHQPRFYVPIHKFHHRFIAPVAMAAEFAHPLEHILSNMLPVSVPPQLIGAHIITAWAFIAYVLLETVTVHSGYDFGGNLASMHDLHHEKFMVNFGTVGWLDRFHGTYKAETPKVEAKKQ
ncbi:hypothetical protein V495_05172 [Pseudogymnoascus sp. VKM F-4514 (FW-929)]|nr:hypothetical protein V495_05172 [Pseudogymnoascus sp. VKM F-4514 (FW-929)]